MHLSRCHSFLKLVMLPHPVCLHVSSFKKRFSIYSVHFYKSSRMRSRRESRELLADAATDVCDAPRL